MTTADRSEFDASMARSIVDAAMARLKLQGPARLLRLGENGVFLLPGRIVARVGRSPQYLPTARREVAVAHWLASTGEVPVVLPSALPQPVLVDQYPVTFWQEIPGPMSRATVPEMGATLRALHRLVLPDTVDLPDLSAFARIEDRIESAPITAEAQGRLRAVLAKLQDAWPGTATMFDLPSGPIHGDAHTGNLLRGSDGRLVLIDLETCCLGPREWDLALTATYATSLGWVSAAEYRDFVDAYGFDVTRSRSFPVLRRIRELRMTSWLAQNAQTSAAVAAEVDHRIECLLDDDLPRHWSRN